MEECGDHLVVRTPHVPTHWWGNFLLLAEVPDPPASQPWLDRFAAAFPAANRVARALVMVADPAYFAIDLYRNVGFEPTETQLLVERKPPGD